MAGLLARVFVALIRRAEEVAEQSHPFVRALAAGVVPAAVLVVGHQLTKDALMLGPGYDALRWALDPHRSVLAIVALGVLRVVGTPRPSAAAVSAGSYPSGHPGRAVAGLYGIGVVTASVIGSAPARRADGPTIRRALHWFLVGFGILFCFPRLGALR